jgi:hypothetical protein
VFGQTEFRTGERTFVHDEKRRLIVEVVDGKPVPVYDGTGVGDARKIIAEYLNGKDLAEAFPKKDCGYVSTSINSEVRVGCGDHEGEASRDRFAEAGGKYINDMEEIGKKNVKVITIDPSKIVDGNGNPIDLKSAGQLRRWLINKYGGREVVVSDNGETVQFTVTGLRDSLKRRGEAHHKIYAALDSLFENGVYYGDEAGDARHPNVERQDIYYAAAQIGDKTFGVRFKVDIKKTEEYGAYKDHKVIEIDDVEVVNTKEPPSPYAGYSPTGTEGGISTPVSKIKAAMGLTDNIGDSGKKVNSKDKKTSGASGDDSFVDLGDAPETASRAGTP